ncbi:MAG TPA: hypothetical protein VIX82_11785 [Solirubrobacteraceae bacterium]
MRLINKKSQFQRFLDKVDDSLDVPAGIKSGLSGLGSANPLNGVLPQGKGLKASMIAGAMVGLTAGSAAISSLRRRNEGARGDS